MTACGKKRYRDELDAKIALASTQRVKASDKRSEKRTYYCKRCRAWHLTSVR